MPAANVAQQLKAASSAPRREVNVYPIPQSLAGGEDGHSIGLAILTAEEELQAAKRAKATGVSMAYELAKASLIEQDGKPLSLVDGSSDIAWSRMHPKVRNLVLQAFAKLHAPEDDETEAFLKGRVVRV